MTTTKASAVILSYRRIGNLRPIVHNLLAHEFVDDVVIFHNDPERKLRLSEVCDDTNRNVFVYNHDSNAYTWGRFLAAGLCFHSTILTQDDDVLPYNLDALWAAWCENPEVIAASMPKGHRRLHKQAYTWSSCQEVLLGWGSIFDRRWICSTFAPYKARYDLDEILLRKADRLFSILLERRHRIIQAQFDELPGARSSGIALYSRPDHARLSREARRRALDLLQVPEAEWNLGRWK